MGNNENFMTDWNNPPKIMTLKDFEEFSKEKGIPVKLARGRYYQKGKDLSKVLESRPNGRPGIKSEQLNGMTQAEAARFLKVSRQYVNEQVKKGRKLDDDNYWIL